MSWHFPSPSRAWGPRGAEQQHPADALMRAVFSLATQAKLSDRGKIFLGGGFDEFKLDDYRKELTIRVSSMDGLYDIINAVERNVKAAQTDHDRRRAQ